MNIRVAIFEDNKLVRDALYAILSGTEGYSCTGSYADGSNWQAHLKGNVPDVALMDIEMPGVNGIDLTRQIVELYPEVKVLIQTVFNDSDKIFRALCCGASGYILKNDSPVKYMQAISEVNSGGAPMNPAVAKKVLSFFSTKAVMPVYMSGEEMTLSDREKQLLSLMLEGHDFRSIADRLFISYETVRTHAKHIYKKLHVASRSEAVRKALQNGLI
ncbi:MAG: response regulator transcription factor [Chitinophagaceae bacterium]|nr:MAG: response regulator transcription factor [Chitinophagaceae bacterium]